MPPRMCPAREWALCELSHARRIPRARAARSAIRDQPLGGSAPLSSGVDGEEIRESGAQFTWTPVVHVHAWKAEKTKRVGYVDYLSAWRAKGIFLNRSAGCMLPVDNRTRRWVPGTATRLARFWDMVATNESQSDEPRVDPSRPSPAARTVKYRG